MKSGEALSKEEFTAFKGCTLQGVYSYLIPVLSPQREEVHYISLGGQLPTYQLASKGIS